MKQESASIEKNRKRIEFRKIFSKLQRFYQTANVHRVRRLGKNYHNPFAMLLRDNKVQKTGAFLLSKII